MFRKKKKPEIVEVEKEICSPITIRITNTGDHTRDFMLFGSAINLLKPNFGNPEDVQVELLTESFDYGSLLIDLIADQLKVSKIRCASNERKNITRTLQFVDQKLIRSTIEYPIKLKELELAIMMDAYQFQADIVETPFQTILNKRNYISGKISPSSQMTITLLVSSVYSVQNLDMDSDHVKQFSIERLSGKNVIPVNYIQASKPSYFKGLWNKIKFSILRQSAEKF